MGVTDLDAKVALAESKRSSSTYVELLQYVRKEKLRVPRVVAKYGKLLIQNHSWRLGSDRRAYGPHAEQEQRGQRGACRANVRVYLYVYLGAVWSLYEQVFIAALDLHDEQLAEALKAQFPKSSRVARLEGMELSVDPLHVSNVQEQRGEFAKAEAIYDQVLSENSANALVSKRKIAILKAQKKTSEVILALNEFLRSFQTDQGAWVELAETYLSIGAYRYAAFCYEELILLNPMDAIFHSRIADIYSTLGGLDNLRVARKHYSHSIEINKHMNVRGYMGLLACTKAIAAHRSYKADADDAGLNERVQQFALDYLTQHYASNAPSDLVEAATTAFKTF